MILYVLDGPAPDSYPHPLYTADIVLEFILCVLYDYSTSNLPEKNCTYSMSKISCPILFLNLL